MSNKKLGSDFEREFAQILDSHGFWVHLMAQNAAGQPFDVLAARNGKTYPIDCKVCVNDYFRLDRVEQTWLVCSETIQGRYLDGGRQNH